VEFSFGNHRLDVDRRELWRGAEQIALEPQVFDLLVYLVRNRDRVVSKDDLLAAVWGRGIVSESTLTSRISAVRKAVGDSGEAQRLIRTVPRKGLRFVGVVQEGQKAAARPEALTEPDGISASRVVRDEIRDTLLYPSEDTGEQSVKNVARPVAVHALDPKGIADLPPAGMPIAMPRRRRRAVAAIVAAAAAVLIIAELAWWLWPATRSSPTPPAAIAAAATSTAQPVVAPRLSIVVLPFANLSDDRDQQYFADGITEDLTTDLSRIGHMFVISHSTAFTYKDKPVNAKQIGRELGVRYVLEGSVRRSGNQVRMNAQLVDATTDAHLWAERFDRDTGDLFVLQNEITSRIAVALNLELIGAEAARPTDNPDALDYILQGRAAANMAATRDNRAQAINLFEHALALDPQSVEARSLLAGALAFRAMDGVSHSAADDIARAEGLIGEALAASPSSPLAHVVKGNVLRWRGRCEEAIPEYETVFASDPNAAGARASLGLCKLLTGSIEETIPLEEQAIRLSPRDGAIGGWYDWIGRAHLLQSRTGEAIVWFERARSANPGNPFRHAYLASAYGLKGEIEHAATELAEARRLIGDDRYSSVAHLRAVGFGGARDYWGAPKIRDLFEATYFAGLRKAGMPEE
jgi:adenylate cyclase